MVSIWQLTLRKKHLRKQVALKKRIMNRLYEEDYTCRLPKVKPRVRYKLKSYFHTRLGMVWQ